MPAALDNLSVFALCPERAAKLDFTMRLRSEVRLTLFFGCVGNAFRMLHFVIENVVCAAVPGAVLCDAEFAACGHARCVNTNCGAECRCARTCDDFDRACDVRRVLSNACEIKNVGRQAGRLIVIERGPELRALPNRRLGGAFYVAPEEVTALLRGEREPSPGSVEDACVLGDEIRPLPPLNLGCVDQSLADGCGAAKTFGRLPFRSFPCAPKRPPCLEFQC